MVIDEVKLLFLVLSSAQRNPEYTGSVLRLHGWLLHANSRNGSYMLVIFAYRVFCNRKHLYQNE